MKEGNQFMNKIAVIYWSGTGNTEEMANAIAEGGKTAASDVALMEVSSFSDNQVEQFDAFAFGCPAMGNEVLEEFEFEPMFEACESKLGSKPVAIFGSYGWGDGEWMREWEARCKNQNINLIAEGLMYQGSPDDDCLEACRNLGKQLS